MFSRLRLMAVATLIAVGSNAWGQQPLPAAPPPQLAPSANAEDELLTEVFSLRNIAAADMQTTLRDLYGGDPRIVVSAQPQTNQLVVVGSPSALEKIATLLEHIDVNSTEPIVQMLSSDSRAAISKSLAQTIAQAAQVELAFDEELGVMMVRSESKDRVKRFTEVLEKLNAQIQEESKVVEREVLVRVSWLLPMESVREVTSAITPDTSLKEAVDKLGKMGYTDLEVAGQLMTRCSISSSSPNFTPEFEVEGHTPEGFDLGVRGHFTSRNSRGDDSIDVNMSVSVRQATKAETRNDCLLSVVLKMKEGKPIILGSAPVAGAQSFFVVQFIEAD